MKKILVAAVTAGLSLFFIGAPQPIQRHTQRLPARISLSPPSPSPEPVSLRSSSDQRWRSASASRKTWRKMAGIYSADVLYAARKTGIPAKLIAAVIHVETRSRNLVSSAGAIGPMQLMPATASQVLHVDPWKPRANIVGGARYLRTLLTLFHGHLRLALEAYNAGPTAVSHGKIPVPAKRYATQVMALAA